MDIRSTNWPLKNIIIPWKTEQTIFDWLTSKITGTNNNRPNKTLNVVWTLSIKIGKKLSNLETNVNQKIFRDQIKKNYQI